MRKFATGLMAVFLALALSLGGIPGAFPVQAREVEIPVSSGTIIKYEPQGDGESQSGRTAGPQVSAPSVLLMEASTGRVIFEKNADEPRSPASITKIMTLILIFDALEAGKIKLTDEVTTSAYAKSMGGSQVYLDGGDIIGRNGGDR